MNRMRWRSLVAGVTVSGTVCMTGGVSAAPPSAVATVVVDGAAPQVIPLTIFSQPDSDRFVGELDGPGGAWSALVNVVVAPGGDGLTQFAGTLLAANASDTPIDLELSFTVDICPRLPGNSLIGGIMQLQVLIGGGGGGLFAPPGDAVFRLLHDTVSAAQHYSDPFFMQGTGAGVITILTLFGLPIPALPAPGIERSASLRFHPMLTAGETGRVILTNLSIAPAPGTVPIECDGRPGDPCERLADDPFDDLLHLLSVWGACPGCLYDLDDDGDVGFGDLLILLACWR